MNAPASSAVPYGLLPDTPGAHALQLGFYRCRGLTGAEGVRDAALVLASLGVVPGEGPWSPRAGRLPRPIDGTEAIAAWLARPGVYLESPESRRARRRPPPRLLPMESWGYGGVRPGHPGHHCQVVFGRRGLDNWEVSVSAAMWHHGTSGATLKAYADSWAALLLRAARALRPRLRPELAVLFASDSPPDLPAAVEKRQLVVGWRTWFAGDYAAALGREWLLGLPDAAQRLADGTVAHALSCTVLDMVSAAPGRYERVAPYVRRRGAPVAWPPALH